MKKRLIRIIGGLIFLLVSTFIGVLVYDNQLNEQENLKPPSRLSSYWNMGYYKIDPETILASLERGDTNVFAPLLEDPRDIVAPTNITIYWTQADFLKIASALGQLVWGDPMDLKDWSVYYISFEGSCDDPIGFYNASITYFQIERIMYTTRLIEINPEFGYVDWGYEETYPKPILQKWKSVDLLGSRITADDALRIVGEDAKVRFGVKNNCGVLIGSPQYSDQKNWYLRLLGTTDLKTYIVNLVTGNYEILTANK